MINLYLNPLSSFFIFFNLLLFFHARVENKKKSPGRQIWNIFEVYSGIERQNLFYVTSGLSSKKDIHLNPLRLYPKV